MNDTGQMLARQIKAARTLLGWSQEDLARAVGLSVATIGKLEHGDSFRSATVNLIRETFEGNGVEFLGMDGVRVRRRDLFVYSGPDAVNSFLDEIHGALKRKGEEINIVCKTGTLFDFDPAHTAISMERLAVLKTKMDATIQCLLMEDLASPVTATLCECRFLSKSYVDPPSFCLFADKLAFFEPGPMPKIIVVQSLPVSQALRKQFDSMWEKAMPMHLTEDTTADIKKMVRQ